MSENSPDNGRQTPTGPKTKSDSKPAMEVVQGDMSVPHAHVTGVEHAVSFLLPETAALQTTREVSQQIASSIITTPAEQNEGFQVTAPERSSPEKSEKSSLSSSSPEKGYETAQQSPSSDTHGNIGSGNDDAYQSAEESFEKTVPDLAGSSPVLRSPDFHSQFLSFPSPESQSQSEGEEDVSRKEKTRAGEAAASTLGDDTTHRTDSILVLDRPQAVGRGSSSRGDVDTELWTKRAMLNLPVSNQKLTSTTGPALPLPAIDSPIPTRAQAVIQKQLLQSTSEANMPHKKSSSSLSAMAAEFVPMPPIDEASAPTTPQMPAEQAEPEVPAAALAPELAPFTSLSEQRIRAIAPDHPANAATEFLNAPELRRPAAPSPARPAPPTPSTTGSAAPPLPVYDNETPGVPSHWIPLYGSTHGMFYDPLTKLFMNDGLPRPIPRRTDGTFPCTVDKKAVADAAAHPTGNPNDTLHVQPATFTTPHIDLPYAPANDRFYCWCTKRWLRSPHDCPPPSSHPPAGAGASIRPDTVLPPGWVTHVAPIRDTSYLDSMGLSQHYQNQLEAAVREAWFESGGGAAAVRGGPDANPNPSPMSVQRGSRPLTTADFAAAGFPVPTRRPAPASGAQATTSQAASGVGAPVTTEEGVVARDFASNVPANRQARRKAEKEAEKMAKKAGKKGGPGDGSHGGAAGGSRGGRSGGAGAGGIAAV